MTAWCENATTGVLRRTGGVQDWLSRGRGTGNSPGGWSQMCHYRGAQEEWGCAGSAKQGQGDQEHSRMIVTAVSLQSCSGGLGCAGSAGQGAEGPGTLQEDGLSYIFVWLHVSL